jgi:hypothetical protein
VVDAMAQAHLGAAVDEVIGTWAVAVTGVRGRRGNGRGNEAPRALLAGGHDGRATRSGQ